MFRMAGDILTLSGSPTCQPPHSLSAHVFLIHTGCVCHWPHCATFTGVTRFEGYPNFKLSPKNELLSPVSLLQLFGAGDKTCEHHCLPCPVEGAVHRGGDSLGKILCGFGLWHLRWASVGVVIGGDVSKTRKGQAVMSVSVSKASTDHNIQ